MTNRRKAKAAKVTPPHKGVSATTVGRWLAGKDRPKSDSLIFLAKALNVSAEIIIFDEDGTPEKTRELTKMVRSIMEAEKEKNPRGPTKHTDQIANFFASAKIPEEDKQMVLRQVKNLLKMYEEEVHK